MLRVVGGADAQMIENPFRKFWNLGYTRLVTVVPPDAELSGTSQLAYRLAHGEDSRGKAPGRRGRDGKWYGLKNWQCEEADPKFFDEWANWGASCGMVMGDGLIAVDIDTSDKAAAKAIYELAIEHLGEAPVRVGNFPKTLLLYATERDAEVPFRKLRFSTATEERAHVELITKGRQFVASGVHPKTNKPYAWRTETGAPPAKADLTKITQDDLDAFFNGVEKTFPNAKSVTSAQATDRNSIDQAALRGDPALIREAINHLPNRDEDFPTRDAYLTVGYAIKAAFGEENEYEALDCFLQWAGRWQRGDERNDAGVVMADFRRMKPPYGVGAQFLFEKAETLGGWDGRAKTFFTPQELTYTEAAVAAKQPERQRVELLTDEDLQTRPDPSWLIGRHIPQDGLGILVGEPGAGKTFIALDMALHIATKAESWHGETINDADRGAVLYIAGEGAGDFKLRVAAWKKQNFMPGEYVPKDRFRAILDPLNFRSEEDVKALIDAIRQANLPKLSFVVIDTLARATPGADENSAQDMGLFIRACDAVRVITGAFVLAVHHPNKGGGIRGSTALLGAADAVLRFDRKKGHQYGRLTCEKMKAGADGFETPFRLDTITLSENTSSLVPTRVEEHEIKTAVCDAKTEAEIHRAISEAWEEGLPWSMAPQARDRYAPRIVAARWGVAAEVAGGWLDLWINGPERTLEVAVFDSKKHIKGLKCISVFKDEEEYFSDDASDSSASQGDIFG